MLFPLLKLIGALVHVTPSKTKSMLDTHYSGLSSPMMCVYKLPPLLELTVCHETFKELCALRGKFVSFLGRVRVCGTACSSVWRGVGKCSSSLAVPSCTGRVVGCVLVWFVARSSLLAAFFTCLLTWLLAWASGSLGLGCDTHQQFEAISRLAGAIIKRFHYKPITTPGEF